jgi:kynurenine formamidase
MSTNDPSPALRQRAMPPACDQGAPHTLSTDHVLAAIRSVREGVVYDLGQTRFPGMPLPRMHPPFEIVTYRTPRGLRSGDDGIWPQGAANTKQVGFTTELLMTSTHVGTHFDSLSHVTVGHPATWFGGHDETEHLSDFGPTHADASHLPPVVTRGVLIDVANHLGVAALERGFGVNASLLREVLDAQDVQVRPGDAVLLRTGYGAVWPDQARITAHEGCGITEDAAQFLADSGAIVVGSDTEAVEQLPSAVPGNPHPVHTLLLVERGIPLLELLDLESVAADKRYTFLFVATPTKIKGATGAMTDPVAIG